MKTLDLKQMLEQAPYRQRRDIGVLPGAGEFRIRAGQLVEVIGEHPQGWLIRLFKSIPEARVGWISPNRLELCPMALAQEGLQLSRFLFLDQVDSKDGLNKVMAFLKSGLFQLLVFDQSFFRITADTNLRKLQLMAEEFGAVLVMQSLRPTQSYSVKIQVDTTAGGDGHYLKVKGGTDGG